MGRHKPAASSRGKTSSSLDTHEPRILPDIANRYWSALQSGDIETAREVIRKSDAPFFEAVMACPGGFDAGIHGVMELRGLCSRWRRPPYHSLTNQQLEQLTASLEGTGVL